MEINMNKLKFIIINKKEGINKAKIEVNGKKAGNRERTLVA